MDWKSDKRISDTIIKYIEWIEQNNAIPILSKEDNHWIEQQIIFRFGKAYDLIVNHKWSLLCPTIHKNIDRWLYPDDNVYEKIKKAYRGWGEYRYTETIGQIMVYNLLRINKIDDMLLPIIMVDTMGPLSVPHWTYNRRAETGDHIIWPLASHRFHYLIGLDDKLTWEEKKHELIFRGVTTGPLVPSITSTGRIKTSRFEIINKWHDKPWANLGFNRIIDSTKLRPQWNQLKDAILNLVKPYLSVPSMLDDRFILCIEGEDIATSFGWALASNSVPIHPYPFVFEVWYFQGLKPWIHFIPCEPDGSDIGELMSWASKNDSKCKEIATAGREHMTKMLDAKLYIEVLRRMYNMWEIRHSTHK